MKDAHPPLCLRRHIARRAIRARLEAGQVGGDAGVGVTEESRATVLPMDTHRDFNADMDVLSMMMASASLDDHVDDVEMSSAR